MVLFELLSIVTLQPATLVRMMAVMTKATGTEMDIMM